MSLPCLLVFAVQFPGLVPATVVNVPLSTRRRRYEPSLFACTWYVRFSCSVAHGSVPSQRWSVVVSVKLNLFFP